MFGNTHLHASNQQLLHNIAKAGQRTQAEDSTDTAQVLRDTFTIDGPCPAVVIGDDSHFRTILINARTKSISLIDPLGQGFSEDIKTSIISLYGKDKSGSWTITEWKKKLQQDSFSCGIWGIWMQEQWMKYWSQETVSASSESWFDEHVRIVPTGGALRQHYYDQMQQAQELAPGGKSWYKQSHEMAATRHTNCRNLQTLFEIHKTNMRHNMQPGQVTLSYFGDRLPTAACLHNLKDTASLDMSTQGHQSNANARLCSSKSNAPFPRRRQQAKPSKGAGCQEQVPQIKPQQQLVPEPHRTWQVQI